MEQSLADSRKRPRQSDADEGRKEGPTDPRQREERIWTDGEGQPPQTTLQQAVDQIKSMFLEQTRLWKTFADSLGEIPVKIPNKQPWAYSINPTNQALPTAVFAENAPVTAIQREVKNLRERVRRVRRHTYERPTKSSIAAMQGIGNSGSENVGSDMTAIVEDRQDDEDNSEVDRTKQPEPMTVGQEDIIIGSEQKGTEPILANNSIEEVYEV